jgi:hypothetical protein
MGDNQFPLTLSPRGEGIAKANSFDNWREDRYFAMIKK